MILQSAQELDRVVKLKFSTLNLCSASTIIWVGNRTDLLAFPFCEHDVEPVWEL